MHATTSEYTGAQVFFALPFWFADLMNADDDRRDPLWRLKATVETCYNHQAWVKAEFTCSPERLPMAIEQFRAKVDRVLARYVKHAKPIAYADEGGR